MRKNSEATETISPLLQFGLLEKSDPSLVVSQITPRSSKNTVSSATTTHGTTYKLDQHQNDTHSHHSHHSSAKGEEGAVEYGFVPRALINSMKDKDWKVRLDGVEKFFELVSQLPSSPPAVVPHMPNLIRFLSKLLFDPNFTICLTSIRLIGEILPKLQHHIKPTLNFFLPSLVEKFGDSKIIIRQETMKVITHIMQIVSPSTVIEVMKISYDEKSPNIQQHILICIIKAFLTFRNHPFDYNSIVPLLLSSLNSPKTKVKQASIEALAILNQVLSESQQTSALLESMLLSQCDLETTKMLHHRFAGGQLPILGPDGSVEFRIGADGSVVDDFFDPSISNTPAPSPGPSRMHTPMASPYAYADDTGLDSKPGRNWSAGAKPATIAKYPPWFPSSNPSSSSSAPGSPIRSPSIPSGSPTPPGDDSHSTDVRRSVFQRTRSLSLSDKGDDGPIFNVRNNQPFASLPPYYSNSPNSPNSLNLPPIISSGGPVQRTPSFSSEPSLFTPTPSFDIDMHKRIQRPPSPTQRDTGYSPSFGKKGVGGMVQYPPPSTVYPPFPDLDPPLSNESSLALNFNYNNHNNFNQCNMPNMNTMNVYPHNNGRVANNSLTVTTNFENCSPDLTDPALQQQQHHARIWSTLKPSTLATFPMGSQSDPPKRRFSGGRTRTNSNPRDSPSDYVQMDSNYGILENVEDDFDFNPPINTTAKTDHPKSASRKPQQPNAQKDDDVQGLHLKSNTTPNLATPSTHDPPRAPSALSRSPKPPRSGNSRHTLKDKEPDTPTPPTPTVSTSGPRQVNTSPLDIIPTEQLLPFDNPDVELKQVMEWFSNGEWYHQFEALASVRILVVYHQRVIVPQIHALLTVVLAATNNLRSLVSRHALVCIGDLFKHVGKHIEPHLDEIMLKILKKYNESNNFLEKELDRAMGLMLLHVSEARAVGVLLMSASNKSGPVRCKVAFFLANLVDILGSRIWNMREADRVLGVVVQLIQESSAEARAQGRRALFLMHQSDSGEFEKVLKKQCNEAQFRKCREVLDKIVSSGDPVSLGAKKPSSAKPSRTPKAGYSPPLLVQDEEFAHHKPTGTLSTSSSRDKPSNKDSQVPMSRDSLIKEMQASPESVRRETPIKGRNSPMREMSKASPTPGINSTAAPELDAILTDLDSQDWRVRYNAITALVELTTKDGKIQALLAARIIKIFDHFTPCLQDANAKVNMFALSSLKQIMPQFRNGMESVLGLLVPALIMHLASAKQEVRGLCVELFEILMQCADPAAMIPHLACGASTHQNPKVKVVLLQFLTDLVGSVYSSKSYIITKHVLPLAFKLLDEKKGELRTVNTKLLQSLFKAMGNTLWENSNSFNLSKQEQTRLHEILIS